MHKYRYLLLTKLLASAAVVCWPSLEVRASDVYASQHTCYEVTPHLHKACHLFLTSEVLYWTLKEKGLDYGMSYYAGDGGAENVYGTVRNIRPHYHLGYRHAIKHEIDNSRWDVNLVWTTYRNESDHRTRLKRGQLFSPFLINQFTIPASLSGANAHLRLDFNAIDFEVGYNLGWKSHFAFRPFAGLKAAKIEQKMRIVYLNVLNTNTGNFFLSQTSRNHSTSHNYGFRVGIDSQYTVTAGFKFFFNAAVAAMWSSFDLQHRENPVGFPPSAVYHNSFRQVHPEMELVAGIGWQKFFKKREYYLDFRLAWEEQLWFSQHQIMREVSETTDLIETYPHDLSLLGPTFSVTFGF